MICERLKNFDRLFYIEKGRIIESGTHTGFDAPIGALCCPLSATDCHDFRQAKAGCCPYLASVASFEISLLEISLLEFIFGGHPHDSTNPSAPGYHYCCSQRTISVHSAVVRRAYTTIRSILLS